MAVTAAAATKKLFAPAMPVFYGQLSAAVQLQLLPQAKH